MKCEINLNAWLLPALAAALLLNLATDAATLTVTNLSDSGPGISPNFSNAILTWPAGESGYTVESTTLLGSSANWTTVPGTPIVIGNQHLLGDGPVTGTRFYRLKTP